MRDGCYYHVLHSSWSIAVDDPRGSSDSSIVGFFGAVAQSVSASVSYTGGCRFESYRPYLGSIHLHSSPNLLIRIKELHSLGYSRRKIAAALGCSTYTVSKALCGEITELGNKVISLRNKGYSIKQIANDLNISKSTASKWCSTIRDNEQLKENKTVEVKARRRSTAESRKIKNTTRNPSCVSTKELKTSRKKFLLSLFGSKCQICGYDKCEAALDFHHIDHAQKLFDISGSNLYKRQMESLLHEAAKCVLLCANCHREVHFGVALSPAARDFTQIQIPEHLKVNRPKLELTSEVLERERTWLEVAKNRQPLREIVVRSDINVNQIKMSTVHRRLFDDYCDNYHYLRRSNKKGRTFCFTDGSEVVGGVLLTSPVRQSAFKNVVEISRMVLFFQCHNLASKCLSLVLRYLRKEGQYDYVQSYCQNDIHLGTIYKAANFRQSGGSRDTYNYDGISKKTIYEHAVVLGLTEHQYAELFGLNRMVESGKTKFIYNLKN